MTCTNEGNNEGQLVYPVTVPGGIYFAWLTHISVMTHAFCIGGAEEGRGKSSVGNGY